MAEGFSGSAARVQSLVEAEQRLSGLLAQLRSAEQNAGAELQVRTEPLLSWSIHAAVPAK